MKNTNNESLGGALFDAIGDINDDLVEEAAVITRRTPMIYKKLWITAAVVLTALSLFGGALYFGGRNSTEPPEVPSITESEMSETAESTENITEATTPTLSGIIPTVTEPQVPQAPTVTPNETTAEVTEPEPTTAAVTEPKETTPHTETETDAPTSPSESTVPADPNDTEDTTAAVTDAPSNPGDTIAGVTDPSSKPNGPQNTTPGVINPPSTTPSARPPETTVAPTKPTDPPETTPPALVIPESGEIMEGSPYPDPLGLTAFSNVKELYEYLKNMTDEELNKILSLEQRYLWDTVQTIHVSKDELQHGIFGYFRNSILSSGAVVVPHLNGSPMELREGRSIELETADSYRKTRIVYPTEPKITFYIMKYDTELVAEATEKGAAWLIKELNPEQKNLHNYEKLNAENIANGIMGVKNQLVYEKEYVLGDRTVKALVYDNSNLSEEAL